MAEDGRGSLFFVEYNRSKSESEGGGSWIEVRGSQGGSTRAAHNPRHTLGLHTAEAQQGVGIVHRLSWGFGRHRLKSVERRGLGVKVASLIFF